MGEPREPRAGRGTPRDQILIDLTLQEQELQGLRELFTEFTRIVQGIYGGPPGLIGEVAELKRWRQEEVAVFFRNLGEAQEIVKYVKGVQSSLKWFRMTATSALIVASIALGVDWFKRPPPATPQQVQAVKAQVKTDVQQEMDAQMTQQEQEILKLVYQQGQELMLQLNQLRKENQQLREQQPRGPG